MKKALLGLIVFFFCTSLHALTWGEGKYPMGWYSKPIVGAGFPELSVKDFHPDLGTLETPTLTSRKPVPFGGLVMGLQWRNIPGFGPETGRLRLSTALAFAQKKKALRFNYFVPGAPNVALGAEGHLKTVSNTTEVTYIFFAMKHFGFFVAAGISLKFHLNTHFKIKDPQDLHIGQGLQAETFEFAGAGRCGFYIPFKGDNKLTFNYIIEQGTIHYKKKVFRDTPHAQAQHVNGGLLIPAIFGDQLPHSPKLKNFVQGFYVAWIHDFDW